jgi:hypothetical protein
MSMRFIRFDRFHWVQFGGPMDEKFQSILETLPQKSPRSRLEPYQDLIVGREHAMTRKEIITWWEARRFRFNVLIIAVGAISSLLVLIAGSAAVKPGVDFVEPLLMIIGPFVYSFLANLCFTLGWIVDTILYRRKVRPVLYKAGLIFSVGLTALPGIWAVAAWWAITVWTGRKLD